ncbi:MAG: hypothetical protein KDE58_21180, partial [Caldilineaceae bacterium]|nr:hypothetical protein [Caldilineaceae bacterium]
AIATTRSQISFGLLVFQATNRFCYWYARRLCSEPSYWYRKRSAFYLNYWYARHPIQIIPRNFQKQI